MHLIADDRERCVIPILKTLRDIEVKRITVGDYVYTHEGKIICIVERKTLKDLAASIKDTRIENHKKLLDAKSTCACIILYIIEGPAYPSINSLFSRISFKCLQGKLDSIMFRNDIKIIWTRNALHTAKRLVGLCHTFDTLYNQGVIQCSVGLLDYSIESVINAKHEKTLDAIHINMLKSIRGISYKAAVSMLEKFNIRQLLLCDSVTSNDWYNAKHPDSMYKLGNRGIKMFNACKNICTNTYAIILSQIHGITKQTAMVILTSISMLSIIKCEFEKNSIADIKKENNRRVGNSIENKIKLAFTVK